MSRALTCTVCEANVLPVNGEYGWVYTCNCDGKVTPCPGPDPTEEIDTWVWSEG